MRVFLVKIENNEEKLYLYIHESTPLCNIVNIENNKGKFFYLRLQQCLPLL